jgi:hypothetical protein
MIHAVQSFARELCNDLSLHFPETADLGEKSSRIGDIPMLAKLSVPEPEHINDVVLNLVARWRIVQETFSRMRSRDGVEDEDKISVGHDPVDGCTMIRNGDEETFVKFDKSGAALICIGIVLDIVGVHELWHRCQIVLLKNYIIKLPDNPLVYFRIHSIAPFQPVPGYSVPQKMDSITRHRYLPINQRIRVVGKPRIQKRDPPVRRHPEKFPEE